MKKLFIFLFFANVSFTIAQQKYNTENDIHYYDETITKKDSYIESQCTLDIYYPENKKDFATIIWFHGGGLTKGKKQIPKALMDKGYAIVAVEYRLSPNVSAPAYIEDAAAAVSWVFNNIEKYGGNKKLIFISGHSAGAYLGTIIVMDKSYLAKYSIDPMKIAGLISFSGQVITHFTIRKEQGIKSTQPTIDKYAPINFVRADTPPILLITGDREMELLGRYEENAYFLRMMKLNKNKEIRLYELQGFNHSGMAEPAFPLLINEVEKISKKILEKK
ncbi:MAG: alpha/beta hydrolase [Flavobacterium sp.]|uniref:alpha/beta hydrolase n=1 Tax=Flavobacterium sp. TaxID=239 RepID=UPI003BC88B52